MTFIPMNYSIEEVLKSVEIPSEIFSYFNRFIDEMNKLKQVNDNLVDEVNKLKQEVYIMERNAELNHEQAEFGRELVREIKEILDRNTKFKDTKQQIKRAIENSYVEL